MPGIAVRRCTFGGSSTLRGACADADATTVRRSPIAATIALPSPSHTGLVNGVLCVATSLPSAARTVTAPDAIAALRPPGPGTTSGVPVGAGAALPVFRSSSCGSLLPITSTRAWVASMNRGSLQLVTSVNTVTAASVVASRRVGQRSLLHVSTFVPSGDTAIALHPAVDVAATGPTSGSSVATSVVGSTLHATDTLPSTP